MSAGSMRRSQSIRDDGLRPVRLSSLADELGQVDRRTFRGLDADAQVREQLPPGEKPAAPASANPAVPGLVWEDPPPARGLREAISAEQASELRRNPGVWARIPGAKSTSIYSWCKHHPGYEATARGKNGSGGVWIRFKRPLG